MVKQAGKLATKKSALKSVSPEANFSAATTVIGSVPQTAPVTVVQLPQFSNQVPAWQSKNCGACLFQVGGRCRRAPPQYAPGIKEHAAHKPADWVYPKVTNEEFGTFHQACSEFRSSGYSG